MPIRARMTPGAAGIPDAAILDLRSLEELARARLPETTYAYYSGAAGEGRTLAANRAAFARLRLRPRVLVGVRDRDLSTSALGEPLAMPIAVAPMALQRLAHRDGETATARAAARAGTAMTLATMATASIEEVATASSGPLWFQVYLFRDRALTRALVERAAAAGMRALVLTVDAPVSGRPRRSGVGGFTLPAGVELANLEGLAGFDGTASGDAGAGGTGISAAFAALIDPSATWDGIAWLRSLSRLPLVLKGIVTAEDARHAQALGAAAVVVSNHGGRVLDGAVATLDALPEVVDAVGDTLEVWVDGGVRSGSDVVKALALGARLVLVGRPILWGLAVAGEEGVVQVLAALRAELDLALALCGCRTPRELGRAHLSGVGRI